MAKPKRDFSAQRRAELARIHILADELGLDREGYENVLWTVARVESSKDLDSHLRRKVIDHLVAAKARNTKPYPGRPNNVQVDGRNELQKIEALLTDAGLSWNYALALAKRMYGKEKLEFCDPRELVGILGALDRKARQRLAGELESHWGAAWADTASAYASRLFGFSAGRNIASSSHMMSTVLRWWLGSLEASCQWPVDLVRPRCCAGCLVAAQSRSLKA